MRNPLRIVLLSLVLIGSLAAGHTVAVAGGPDASAAKKCKKPYKKKRGKCRFTAADGLYTSKDGSVRLRVLGSSPKFVRLFRTGPVELTCTGGAKQQGAVGGLGVTAQLKKTKFKYDEPNRIASFQGKFTSTKKMKGSFTLSQNPAPGISCTSAAIKFSAKWKSS